MASTTRVGRVLVTAFVMVAFAASGYAGRNKLPTIAITSPSPDAVFAPGESILFQGTASDKEDGDLSASLEWSSDREGVLGTGGQVAAALTALGAHVITASVTDSGGATGSDSIPITITEPVDPLQITGVEVVQRYDGNNDPIPNRKYERVELLVTLDKVAATELYDPDPAHGGLDLSATFSGPGGTWTVPGFYDGTHWRIRFAPNAAGTWDYAVTAADPSGTSNTVESSFSCEDSPHPGWARIDGHWLRFTNGDAVAAVGHNNGWLYEVRDPDFATMAGDDLNLLSFWMVTPWAETEWMPSRTPIENAEQGIGEYNQAACTYLDAVVADAEGEDVYLLPTIWSHDQLCDQLSWGAPSWWQNAYQTLCSPADFYLTGSSEQWRYQRNFYRYLLARWGYSRAIVGWVGVCEVEGTDGYYAAYGGSESRVESWITEVRNYFAQNDAYRTNGAGEYPMAFTKTDYYGDWNDWGGAVFDQRAVDSYASQNNSVAVAQTLATETMAMWGTGKPAFHAEWGAPSRALQPAHLHNGIWAATASGAALTPLVWCDGYDFPTLTDPDVGDAMRAQLQILAQFLAARDYLGDPGLAPDSIGIDSPCRGWTLKKADRGFAWIQNTTGTINAQQITISGLVNGEYTVKWFDVWTSGTTVIQTDIVTVDTGALIVSAPTLGQADIACTFDRTPNNVPVALNDAFDTDEDIELNVAAPGVLANDTDADSQPLTAILVDAPASGSLVLDPAGSFTYTPDGDYNGIDSFTYQASDGIDLSNVATVTITVNSVNDPPVASFTYAANGLTCDVDASASSDPDGTIVSYEWDFGDGGVATGVLASHPYPAADTYTITLTVTDNGGATDSQQQPVTVSDTTAMHVLSVDVTVRRAGINYFGEAAVIVVDQNNDPVEGATVTVQWSDAVTGAAAGITDPLGEAVIASPKIKKVTPGSTTFTATVTDVAKAGATYNPAANVETEGSAVVQ